VEDAQLRITLDTRIDQPFEIGETVKLDLSLSYENLKPGSRIYAHLLPVRGEKWVTVEEGLFSVSDPKFSFSGGISDGDKGFFNFSAGNYPINLLIKNDMLEVLFKGLGIPEESVQKLVENIATSDKGYDLSMAFLASNGQKKSGHEKVKLGFKVPDYYHCYDGITIALFILTYDRDNKASIFTKTANMPGLKVPVKPYQPCPEEKKKEKKVTMEDISGNLRISAFYPTNAILYTGASNTLEVECTYTDLEENSAIYLAFLPSTERNKFLFGQYLLTLPGIKGLVNPTFFESGSEFFRIPSEDAPIKVPFTSGQTLEAAQVGVVKKGGDGKIKGTVTFTPPPYTNRYRRVYLMPLLLVPTPAGNQVLMDTYRLEGKYVNVSEN